jgi:NAD(P)-dependent dehydrogenase (short-subunit alcohol dehydrogenase family)
MEMTGMLEGKVALITGATSGIGLASARTFVREGARVVVCARHPDRGRKVEAELRASGGEAAFVAADVTRMEEVETLVARTVELYGRLDIAFNNVGLAGREAPIHEYTEEDWDPVMDANLKSMWICMKHEVIQMLAQGEGGAILNNSSIGGVVAAPLLVAYFTSKHAILGLSKTAALEYAQAGIRVNSICPGFTDTPGLAADLEARKRNYGIDARGQAEEMTPMRRLATPEEMAEAAVWLCSDRASYVTGQALVVDGGVTVQIPFRAAEE